MYGGMSKSEVRALLFQCLMRGLLFWKKRAVVASFL